jgi:hypothetical protein
LLLATTELGTDAWIKDLLGPAINQAFSIDGAWVLVYTATIMLVLRASCGPIIERLKPLGVLAASSGLVAIGIFWLSVLGGDAGAGAVLIILAATIYGVGQTFFWPTTLGFVSEQFPRGGAMTINVIAGVGMLGVGVLGNPWLGNVQDRAVTEVLAAESADLHERYATAEKDSMFGSYRALDANAVESASSEDLAAINSAQVAGKMEALRSVVVLPLLMLAAYIALMLYFRTKGGYHPVLLADPDADAHAKGDAQAP